MELSGQEDLDEKDWQDFVDGYRADWIACKEKSAILAEVGSEDLAIALHGVLLSRWRAWLDRPSDALNGKSAKECLKTKEGTKLVKQVLMRMHV